jgi:hypothetical protein
VRCWKNQVLRFPPPFAASCCSRPDSTGSVGPSAPPPPPRSGFAMRDPAPPNATLAPDVGEPRPRVEPALAASRRSLTTVSWASNLIAEKMSASASRGRVVVGDQDRPVFMCKGGVEDVD